MLEQKTLTLREYFEAIAKENFDRWHEMLISNDEGISRIYSDDCTFLPNLSSDIKFEDIDGRDYFECLFTQRPTGKLISEDVHIIDDYCYLHSGVYDLEIPNPDGGSINSVVWFTFLWKKRGRDWKIFHHHFPIFPN